MSGIDLIIRELEGKSFLLGDMFTAADLHLYMLARWGRMFESHPPNSDAEHYPNVVRHWTEVPCVVPRGNLVLVTQRCAGGPA